MKIAKVMQSTIDKLTKECNNVNHGVTPRVSLFQEDGTSGYNLSFTGNAIKKELVKP